MKLLSSLFLLMSLMVFTSCSHFSKGGECCKKDKMACCDKDKKECKDGSCDLKKGEKMACCKKGEKSACCSKDKKDCKDGSCDLKKDKKHKHS